MQRRDRNRPAQRRGGKISRRVRRTIVRGIESLESRRLLSADFGAEQLGLQSAAIEKPLAPQPPAQVEPQMQAAADAGETLGTAQDLQQISGALTLRGYVGWWDSRDVYRFELGGEAEIDLQLDQLAADVDLSIHDQNGRLLGTSASAGSSPEQLQGTVAAGTYYVNVEPWGWADSTYRLTLEAELTAPATPEPDDPVAPLPEAPEYGGADEWNLNAIAAPEAWQAGYTGQGVTVAVVDTGIDLDHPDLGDRVWTNSDEIAGNGTDDDGNGYVDDFHGWDFVGGDSVVEDGNGHGTHVAGTVVAGQNGFGATGVASGVRLMPVRVLGDGGSGSVSGVAAGIRYAADNGADVINLSLGGGYSSEIAAAIEYAGAVGSFIVTAAGNQGASEPAFPARHSASMAHVISVGAHDVDATRASFSNRVGDSGAVQVDAPGVSVFSTYVGGQYARSSGTSMAAPHVAGLAALSLAASPESVSLTAAGLRQLVIAGAERAIAGSDALGGIDAAITVALAAAGISGSDASASTSAAIDSGVSNQSLAAFRLPTPASGLARRVAAEPWSSGSEPWRASSSAAQPIAPVVAASVAKDTPVGDSVVLPTAIGADDDRTSPIAENNDASEPTSRERWQQTVDAALRTEITSWV